MSVKASKTGQFKKYKKFSEKQQIKVAWEIHEGLIKPRAAGKKYGVCQSTLYNWINKYSFSRLARGETHSINTDIDEVGQLGTKYENGTQGTPCSSN